MQADVDYTRLQRPPLRWTGQTLRTELREARARQVPYSEICGDVSLRVDTLLREQRFDEILEAYAHYGQLTAHTLNEVLLRLAEHDPELFVRRALDFFLPEMLREQVEQALQRLAREQHPNLAVHQQRYREQMGHPPTQTPQPAATAAHHKPAPGQPVAPLPDLRALQKTLGKPAHHLPKKIRKEYLRCQQQILARVPGNLGGLIEAGIRFNLFSEVTAQAARDAYVQATRRRPEDL